MKGIVRLFKRDVRRVRSSVIACVVAIGLVIVPVLYAWFNIAGSWDPYGNTGNLKVAVANGDAGYRSDVLPVQLNMGETVMSSLRENTQLNWQFVDEEEAIEGVRSGEYYAAVVIPSDFSASMMTVFSGDAHHAQIAYYENQKANAIAPRVTDKAASTVRQQVDETFTKALGSAGMTALDSLLEVVDSDQVSAFAADLEGVLDMVAGDLQSASEAMSSSADLFGSSSALLESTEGLVEEVRATISSDQGLMDGVKTGLSTTRTALDEAAEAVGQAAEDGAARYEDVSTAIDGAYEAASSHVDVTVRQIDDVAGGIESDAAVMRGIQAEIKQVEEKVEANENLPEGIRAELVEKIDIAQNSAGNVANRQELAAQHLRDTSAALKQRMGDAAVRLQDAKALIAQAKDNVGTIRGTYDAELDKQLDALSKSLGDAAAAGEELSGGLVQVMDDLANASSKLGGDFEHMHQALSQSAEGFAGSARELIELRDRLGEAIALGDAGAIRDLIGSDPVALASALAAPVALDRKPVYHIENYGSAMAPFYTTLSLWVGGIVLAAMLKAQVDEETVRELAPVRLHELYLGRYAFFAVLALAQATLVCAGDLWFFGIQCAHPFQFMLVGWVAGLVFSNIIYTLTVSFGDVGKAIAVVLLVMQVAGSGGTFPIEMTAPFFQGVYPLLPFTHAINAMHAAMAGAYGMEFWTELGILASYLLPSLVLGLLLRRPVIRANAWVAEKLEETHLM